MNSCMSRILRMLGIVIVTLAALSTNSIQAATYSLVDSGRYHKLDAQNAPPTVVHLLRSERDQSGELSTDNKITKVNRTMVARTQKREIKPFINFIGTRTFEALPRLSSAANYGDRSAPQPHSQMRLVIEGENALGSHGLPRRVLLKQPAIRIGDTWRMNNSFGDQRIRNQSIVASGYRYSLPTPKFRGFATRVAANNTEINWAFGQPIVERGKKSKSFDTTSDEMIGLGARHSITRNWRIGGQAWMLWGDAKSSVQRNFAGEVEYFNPSTHRRHAVRLAQDSDGGWGAWLDNDQSFGDWRQRYGAYHFEPRLRWINKRMAADREGLYWRTDYARGGTALFGGLELERTNVNFDSHTIGLIRTFGFAGIKRELDADTSLSGCVIVGIERYAEGTALAETRIHKLNLSLDRQFLFGQGHFGARFFRQASVKTTEQRLGLRWEHSWLDDRRNRVKTSLGLTHTTRGDETYVVPVTGFKLGYAPTRAFQVEASLNYLWGETGNAVEDASYASLAASWQIDRHWHMTLSGRWDAGIASSDGFNRDLENRIDLAIVYQPGSAR